MSNVPLTSCAKSVSKVTLMTMSLIAGLFVAGNASAASGSPRGPSSQSPQDITALATSKQQDWPMIAGLSSGYYRCIDSPVQRAAPLYDTTCADQEIAHQRRIIQTQFSIFINNLEEEKLPTTNLARIKRDQASYMALVSSTCKTFVDDGIFGDPHSKSGSNSIRLCEAVMLKDRSVFLLSLNRGVI